MNNRLNICLKLQKMLPFVYFSKFSWAPSTIKKSPIDYMYKVMLNLKL